MSFNARWRYFRIVEPQAPNKEDILIGGLKNALERGESIEKAKQSFINAGYKPEEVTAAAQKVPATTSKINTSPVAPTKTASASQPLPAVSGQKKQISKKFTIILISLAVVVIIGIIFAVIFRNKLF